jgi:vancomycin resistance protein YoaR
LKGAYKKKSGRPVEQYGAKKRNRRRNRRVAGVALIVFVLLAVVVADHLVSGSDPLRGVHLSGLVGTGETESPAASDQQGTTEDQGTGKPSVLLAEFFTDYAWDPDPGRRSNLKTASGAIDGTILAPGEVFSALDKLESQDYQPAKVFSNGGVGYTEGGGLCQVSSTLYMAANYAGLEIVERNPHYAELPYIRPGLDATVWFGDPSKGVEPLNMKFKNNTDQNILIREFVNDDGFLIAQIYGEKPAGKTVSMYSEKVSEDLQKGIKWDTYKKVTDENGKVLEDGLLFETVYSYNPPLPPELKHETNEPRGAGWVDTSNTTGWNNN